VTDTVKNDGTGSRTRAARRGRRLLGALALAGLAGCTRPGLPPPVTPLAALPPGVGAASPRRNGDVGSPESVDHSVVSYGTGQHAAGAPQASAVASTGADVSLNFADTDIREVTAQILGGLLHVNYTIDPAVHGTATLHTAVPIPRDELFSTLQVLLSQTGATMVKAGTLYRVLPAAAAGTTPGLANSAAEAGDQVIPLRYATADQLARVLQPFAGTSAHVAAEAGSNAVIIAGDPVAREALANLVRAFDVDSLANQSFALLPVGQGNAREFATALQQAMDTQGGAPANAAARAGLVRIVAMERINAVLVSAPEQRTIDQARRIFTLVQRQRQTTVRSWHVYYLQNGRSNDVAYSLQQAFTPDHVTAQPSGPAQLHQVGSSNGGQAGGLGGIGQGGAGSGGVGGIGGGSLGGLGSAGGGLGSGSIGGAPAASAPTSGGDQNAANPLLGGLDPSSGGSGGNDTMRIIPNTSNNALMIYGTPQEFDTVEAMLRKIDILPLQVRIDAVIAEVELNDALQYGTQFFFKSGGLNGTLAQVFNATNNFSGYLLAGSNASQVALNMLQAVSTVHVLSSPELMVLDNQPARLEVGDLVPYLTQQAQSTVTSTSDVINSVSYEQTGVILEVTPRVNSDGLVTLDVAQEVSNIDTSATATVSNGGITSPTFLQRDVQSRVVVQDGQTIGLAGLIQDSVTRSNQGVPFLKDVPVLGALFGQQNNSRTRTELLVLITPHVVHDQRDVLALTQDLREQLPDAAGVPAMMEKLRPSGSDDPNLKQRHNIGLEQ
jgi:general secretion pathway protein D